MAVIIPRNTQFPCKFERAFIPEDGETSAVIKILQGEKEMAHECLLVARSTIWNVRDAGMLTYEID